MKVLFCTDGSKISYNAIRNFSHWAKDFTADVICAIDWSFLPDSVSIEDSEFSVMCTNSADSILDYAETLLKEENIQLGKKIKMCGATVDCILEACSKENYDAVILGSNGKKGIQKWLGSVSQEVASVVKIPTYISKEANNYNKILFGIENSDNSPEVIRKSLEMLNLENKEIYLTTVYEVPDYLFLEGNLNTSWILEVRKKQEISAQILLNESEKIFSKLGLVVKHKEILAGNPSSEIIKYAQKEGIDLVICGTKQRKNLSKFLLSSVSKRILENTNSDVFLIRPI
ncbi:universal stress protein [bacterium]|nr:universal stress protein [bacterium]